MRKTETIKKELGSLSKVIDDDIERRSDGGIRHRDAERLAHEIEQADLDAERKRVAEEELEAARERQEDLKAQIERCQNLLEASRNWVGFEPSAVPRCALVLAGAARRRAPRSRPRTRTVTRSGRFPPLDRRAETDASWAATLDTLRAPRKTDQKLAEWRREAPIRPVVFEDAGVLSDDTVHLHLEQRVVQRLLARFRSQGFIHHDLSRACLAQAADSIPRVILLGRLSLYGRGAERLHEEIVPLAARWIEPPGARAPSRPTRETRRRRRSTSSSDRSPARAARTPSETIQRKLLDAAARDIEELLPQLEPRAEELAELAIAAASTSAASGRNGTCARRSSASASAFVEELAKHEKAKFDQLTLGFRRGGEAAARSRT